MLAVFVKLYCMVINDLSLPMLPLFKLHTMLVVYFVFGFVPINGKVDWT